MEQEQGLNQSDTCPHCGWWHKICKCQPDQFRVYTSKDKLWEFNEEFNGKQHEIRTKGQWRKFMRRHGLHDDVKQDVRQPSDYIRQQPVNREAKRREYANYMLQELHGKGLYNKLIRKRR